VKLNYDPTGRLSRLSQNGVTLTTFEHLGPRLIIERNAAGSILRRYVHGPGDDEPVVWYEGATLTTKRYLHTDERGSVIAVSDSTGASIATNRYDEYGIPQSSVALAPGTSGRFMYTGQMWIPEVGLYYYKARFYSPTLGRFMQSDPIGYKDGINWYAYVDDDPINRKDPTGLATCANKNCTLSKIDVKPNGPNGPTISSKPGVDRTVTTPTAKMVEAAVISSGAKSVNLSDGRSSSAPHQAGTSRHAVGKAVDINEVNGVKVSPTNAGATALQKAFSNQINIRENFGPNSQTKTVNGSVQAMGNNVHQSGPHKGESIRQEHQNHLHVSGQD
jgi:RHS repeat-associated protein